MDDSPVRIETPRLVLRLPSPAEAGEVLAFFTANRAHLAPWDPPHPPGFLTRAYWVGQLARNRKEAAEDRSLRLFMFLRSGRPRGAIGTCNLSNFVRGAFQACHLGYSIDRAHEGRGLMSEALGALLAHAFGPLGLHRVMANYVPTNERSGRVLERLGFAVEGYARDYLYIGGGWKDHVLTALVSPDASPPRPRT